MSRAQRLPACQCESGDLVQLHNGTLLCNPNRSLLDGGLRESTKRIYTRGHPADACELGQKNGGIQLKFLGFKALYGRP
jgi:hypothetical protein